MRINGTNPGLALAKSETANTKGSEKAAKAGTTPEAQAGAVVVEGDSLETAGIAAAKIEAKISQRIQQIRIEITAGTYEIDTQALSERIVDEELMPGDKT